MNTQFCRLCFFVQALAAYAKQCCRCAGSALGQLQSTVNHIILCFFQRWKFAEDNAQWIGFLVSNLLPDDNPGRSGAQNRPEMFMGQYSALMASYCIINH